MKTITKVTFRVITPNNYADLDGFHPEGKNAGPYKSIETIEDATNSRDCNRITIYKDENGVTYCRDRKEFLEKFTKVREPTNELELKKITATLLGLKELRGNHKPATVERSMYSTICDTLLLLQERLTKQNTSDEKLH